MVASATGMPATGNFRVRLGNVAGSILRVTARAGTTLTVDVEQDDGNALVGDTVRLVNTAAAMEALKADAIAGGGGGGGGVDISGHCRLTVDSTTQLSLQRHKGSTIPMKVGGVWTAKTIPSTAPTLANTGLTAATLYYIYAFDSAGTLTLEASTTTHAVDADTGVEIKSGDATRTLVGMVFMDAGTPGTFIDSTAKRWCLNWFNRRRLDVQGTISANRNVQSFSFVELNAEIRTPFLTWADEAVSAAISGSAINNSANPMEVLAGVAFDGTTPEACTGGRPSGGGTFNGFFSIGLHVWKMLSEGSHYATFVAANDDNTNSFTFYTADAASAARAKAWVRVGVMG